MSRTPRDDPNMTEAQVIKWCKAQGWNAKQTADYVRGWKQVKDRRRNVPPNPDQ